MTTGYTGDNAWVTPIGTHEGVYKMDLTEEMTASQGVVIGSSTFGYGNAFPPVVPTSGLPSQHRNTKTVHYDEKGNLDLNHFFPSFVPFPTYGYTITTNRTGETAAVRNLSRESELVLEVQQLEAALESVTQDLVDAENVLEMLDEALAEENLTRSDLFLLEQRHRMEEKGWTVAFLSPSVIELLKAKSIADYTEEGVPFFYDAGNPNVE